MVFAHFVDRKTEARESMPIGQRHIVNREVGYEVRQSGFQVHVFTINVLASKTSACFNIQLDCGYQYFKCENIYHYNTRTTQVNRQERLGLSQEASKVEPWGKICHDILS